MPAVPRVPTGTTHNEAGATITPLWPPRIAAHRSQYYGRSGKRQVQKKKEEHLQCRGEGQSGPGVLATEGEVSTHAGSARRTVVALTIEYAAPTPQPSGFCTGSPASSERSQQHPAYRARTSCTTTYTQYSRAYTRYKHTPSIPVRIPVAPLAPRASDPGKPAAHPGLSHHGQDNDGPRRYGFRSG